MTKAQIKRKLVSGGMDMSAVSEISTSEVEIFIDAGNRTADPALYPDSDQPFIAMGLSDLMYVQETAP